ncbi:MAG: hypothetical protein EYC62_05130 [Alphaproteobacteria bacterium]|nr:MAG: hypothetical protein EYC62_05130 [Alphaproteobacteria bacterium]
MSESERSATAEDGWDNESPSALYRAIELISWPGLMAFMIVGAAWRHRQQIAAAIGNRLHLGRTH